MEEIFLFINNHPWFLVAVFGVVQLGFFIFTMRRLSRFGRYFPEGQNYTVAKDDEGRFSIDTQDKSSEDFKELVKELNEYLSKNEGTSDFGIIKDKVQSRLDSLYENATSKVSFPTLLGLLGTFVGVWCGLQSFKYGIASDGVSDATISALVGGIIISMATSVVGLILMMWGSSRASRILKGVETRRNGFFDFIQVQLMPELGTSMVSALNSLRRTVGKFEPSFRSVIADFKTAFGECTETLRGTFGESVEKLTNAVNVMASGMDTINANVSLQKELLATMQQPGTLNTLQRFVEAADKFDSATTAIANLNNVKNEIAQSSAQLIEAQKQFMEKLPIPKSVFEKINAILNRVTTFEDSLNGLAPGLAAVQNFGNELINLINTQLNAIKQKGVILQNYQDTTDENLQKYYKEQQERIQEFVGGYRRELQDLGTALTEALQDTKKQFEQTAADCLRAVNDKRNQYIEEIKQSLDIEAKDQHLAKLEQIPDMFKTLDTIAQSAPSKEDIKNISDKLGELKEAISKKKARSGGDADTTTSGIKPKKGLLDRIFGRGN